MNIIKFLFASAIIAVFLTNCSTGTDTSIISSTLRIGNGTEPKDLDPHIVTGVVENNIISALLEGLVSEDPKTLAPLPAAAKSWEISDSGKVYTFKIGEDRRWSNGDSVTADDFVYSWRRILSPALASEYAYMLFPIKSAKQFNSSEITDFSKVGVKAVDRLTLRVTLNNATPYFLSLLSHFSTFPVNKKCIEKFGKIDESGTGWTKPGNFIGNGPYNLDTWELNKVIKVKKSSTYWDSSTVTINEIDFLPIDNSTTEERMFRSDQLDITSSVPSEKIESYKKNSPKLIRIAPYLGTYYYRFNTTKKPLNDMKIRRALSMAIDRELIVKKITKGGQLPAFSFVPPNTRGYNSKYKTEFNLDSARALFRECGYLDSTNSFPEIEILYNSSDAHKKIAIVIQQMWEKSLGVKVSLVNQEWKVYLDSQKSLNYDICRAGWIGDYADPNTFLDMFISNGGNNQTGWSNTTYDSLINAASKSNSDKDRFNIFNQAEKILIDEMVIMPIYTYTRVYLISKRVSGWSDNIFDHHPYKFVRIN